MSFKNVLKNGKGYASSKNLKQFRNTEKCKNHLSGIFDKKKGFVREVAERTGLDESTVKKDLQIATRLSDEVKDIIRDTELADRKMDLLEQDKYKSGNCYQDK
jgi:hypothetical protein